MLSCFFLSVAVLYYTPNVSLCIILCPRKKLVMFWECPSLSDTPKMAYQWISKNMLAPFGAHPYVRTRSPTSKSYTLTIHTCHLRKTLAIGSKFDFRLQDVGFQGCFRVFSFQGFRVYCVGKSKHASLTQRFEHEGYIDSWASAIVHGEHGTSSEHWKTMEAMRFCCARFDCQSKTSSSVLR